MTESQDAQQIPELEQQLQYAFLDREILSRALTHTSLRDAGIQTNERLEFLGDAVLGLVVSEYLFREHADFDEGGLTQVKSVVVSERILAQIARELGLEKHLRVGKGLLKLAPLPDSILADALEAVIAAIYVDGGFEPAKSFILRQLSPRIGSVLAEKHELNYKSLLQHLAQKRFKATPKYSVISEEGPDHGKVFEVIAKVGRRKFPAGRGRNKKEAEQHAARNAFEILLEKTAASEENGKQG